MKKTLVKDKKSRGVIGLMRKNDSTGQNKGDCWYGTVAYEMGHHAGRDECRRTKDGDEKPKRGQEERAQVAPAFKKNRKRNGSDKSTRKVQKGDKREKSTERGSRERWGVMRAANRSGFMQKKPRMNLMKRRGFCSCKRTRRETVNTKPTNSTWCQEHQEKQGKKNELRRPEKKHGKKNDKRRRDMWTKNRQGDKKRFSDGKNGVGADTSMKKRGKGGKRARAHHGTVQDKFERRGRRMAQEENKD